MTTTTDSSSLATEHADLSALAWVHDELRRSVETAHKAMRRHLKETEALVQSDIDAVDPMVMRNARSQLHQCAGALELVRLPEAAKVLRASEAALQRVQSRARSLKAEQVAAVEQASFAVLEYVNRLLLRKPVSPLALFPAYRAVQELAGADRVHPADLWPQAEALWQWRDIAVDAQAVAYRADEAARGVMEAQMLAIMRGTDERGANARMSDLCAGLGRTSQGQAACLWRLAAGFFQALADGALKNDVFCKRLASRLLAQLRLSVRGSADVSERLAQDLLFFCAHAQADATTAPMPRWRAVRDAYGFDHAAEVDYEAPRLGQFDPAWLTQARKRVATAKELWSTLAAGELQRLPDLHEQFHLVGDSLRRLYPQGDVLAQALAAAASHTMSQAEVPSSALAMEVATAMLFIDASLEDAEFNHPDMAQRVSSLANRVVRTIDDAPPQPLEGWMEQLYRRVSDRQTMGSVVHELRAALSEAEKHIDQYFRHPNEPAPLVNVPRQLSTMRGVLSVLGMDEAALAVMRMGDDVDGLLARGPVDAAQAPAAQFEHLADNVGALSFLIDMLHVQPQLAKTLFRYDPNDGSFRAVMASPLSQGPAPVGTGGFKGEVEELAAAAAAADVPHATVAAGVERMSQQALLAEEPALAQTMESAQAAMAQASDDDSRQALRQELAQVISEFTAKPSTLPVNDALQNLRTLPDDVDGDMRAVFVEEAREVVSDANHALSRLEGDPGLLSDLTALRRAFHTLKGSGRMVGLVDFGEAAWACEQVLNTHLAQHQRLNPELAQFSHQALNYLGSWVEALASDEPRGHSAEPVVAMADAWRNHGLVLPLRLPEGAVLPATIGAAAPASSATAEPVGLKAMTLPLEVLALDLNLEDPAPADAEQTMVMPHGFTPHPVVQPMQGLVTLDLNLDLPPDEPVPTASPLASGEATELELEFNELFAEALAGSDASVEVPEPADAAPAANESSAPSALAAAAPTSSAELPESDVALPVPEDVKVVGDLHIPIGLFNVFLNEADELSRRLCTELAEWAMETSHAVGDSTVALAHSLAGSSATVGYEDLSTLARALEQALMRSQRAGHGVAGEAVLFTEAAEEIRRLLHQFAAGFLKDLPPELMQRLAQHESDAAAREASQAQAESRAEPAVAAAVSAPLLAPPPMSSLPAPAPPAGYAFDDDDIDDTDGVDEELFAVFSDEGEELVAKLHGHLRDWVREPQSTQAPAGCMRALHTFKGGARLAGAMRLGEQAHRLEAAVEHIAARGAPTTADFEGLLSRLDSMGAAFEGLQAQYATSLLGLHSEHGSLYGAPESAYAPMQGGAQVAAADVAPPLQTVAPSVGPAVPDVSGIPWERFADDSQSPLLPTAERAPPSLAAVRVRAPLLDRLVNQAGEVSMVRARIDNDVGQMKGALGDLDENLARMRRQLRDIEVQAETQIASRLEAAKAAAQEFDPLEMDRFTRLQELTRMMAESVNDVATVHRGMGRALQSAEDELAAQARLTRDLQDDLLRTRMVEFESLADRLYRVVRQAAKETGKAVRLDIEGGNIEVDRGVLERMAGPFEHLLRNSVTHGVEEAGERSRAGKDATGTITVAVRHEGNEVEVVVRDDGAGLNLPRIRDRAVALGLLKAEQYPSVQELTQLIFSPGFSTASEVTELAGRGIGMDVVRAEVAAIGGRIETETQAGHGTQFRLVLPLTTAVTQIVMLRCGRMEVAVPSTLVEVVLRSEPQVLQAAHAQQHFEHGGQRMPFYWMAALLQDDTRVPPLDKSQPVVVVRSAQQHVALQVDEVLGNQEVVVKSLGPQLARLPGLAGMSLLPSGKVALIYNPVALGTLYGAMAHERMRSHSQHDSVPDELVSKPQAPLVMVVDDSLTVRRVTQRLLAREGYRVVLAKDGMEALELLGGELPAVILSDIEMPRMDGFDLLRNLRSDPTVAHLPVIMITSRIAQKHRLHAQELGANHYLGKPYSEEELLALVGRHVLESALK